MAAFVRALAEDDMILGLDLSLTETGWYDLRTDTSGLIRPPKDVRGTPRLDHIEKQLTALFRDLKPACVVVEGYAMGAKGQVFQIGEWGGIARLTIYRMGIDVFVISPMTLKKFVSGKGNSEKQMMLLATYKRWGREFSNNNLCDAFGLALMGLAIQLPNDYEKRFGALNVDQRASLLKHELIPGKPATDRLVFRSRIRY